MRSNYILVSLAFSLVGCLQSKSTDTGGDTSDNSTDTADTNDTQPPEEEVLPVIPVQGGIIVKHYALDYQYPEETAGNGIFIDSTVAGFGDVALCIVNGWCFSTIPQYSELTAIDASEIDLQINQPRDVGNISVINGTMNTDAYYDNTELHYYSATGDLGYVGGEVAMEIAAGDYFAGGVSLSLEGPETFVLTSPDPMSPLEGNGFGGKNLMGELIWDLTWEPGLGDAQVYINAIVRDSNDTSTVYLVTPEDTGSYTLDLNGLVIDPESQLQITVGRYSGVSSEFDGQSVSFHITSEQWLYGSVTADEMIDNEAPYTDTCDENGFSEALSTGVYAYGGTLSSSLADDLTITCTEWGSLGQDGFIEVVLQDGETLDADLRLSGDAVLYLLDSCGASECLTVADDTLDGDLESISYTNDSGAEMTAYLGIDVWINEGDSTADNDYLLNISIQ